MNRKQYLLFAMLPIISGFVGGVVANWVLSGAVIVQDRPKVIMAEEFQLVNKDGKLLAKLGLSSGFDPETVAKMKESDAKMKEWEKQRDEHFGRTERKHQYPPWWSDPDIVSGGAPELKFYNGEGIERFFLGLNGMAYSRRLPCVGQTHPFESVELRSDGLHFSSFYHRTSDKEEEEMHHSEISLGYDWAGAPNLTLRGDHGDPDLSLDNGSLDIFGLSGEGIIGPRVLINGDRIALYDDDGSQRSVIGEVNLEITRTGEKRTRSISSIVLFDKDGKVLWSAP
jgi:hypothetical protein